MDINLNYPDHNYIKRIKRAVNSGNTIHITITKPKLVKLVKATLIELQGDSKSKSSCIGFFARWFRLLTFLTGHFYAEASEYTYSFKENGNLEVTYAKNT